MKRIIAIALFGAASANATDIAKDLPKVADISVNGLELCLDIDEIAAKIGSRPHRNENLDELDFHADFANQKRTQVWSLIGHPGSAETDFELLVRRAGKDDVKLVALPVAGFTSGKGVHLGMTSAQLTAIFGAGSVTKNQAVTTIAYTIDPFQFPWNEEFGHRCGFPGYAAEYQFVGGKLEKFRFGSPNP